MNANRHNPPVISRTARKRRVSMCAAALLAALAISGAYVPAIAGPGDTAAAYEAAIAKMNATEVDAAFEDAPLAEVVAWVQEQSGVNIVLDPRVRREWTDSELTVTLHVRGSNALPVPQLAARSFGLALGCRG